MRVALRIDEETDRELLVGPDRTEGESRRTDQSSAFTSTGNDSTCEGTESAPAKAHDEPTALFSAADGSGNMVQFKEKYGVTQCDDELLNVADEEMSVQSHVESFQESLSDGTSRAGP